jgi:pimeloyl-ACP methyl ester carboxylesterase
MTKTILRTAATIAPGPTARWAARRFLTPRPVGSRDDELEVLATATRGELVSDSGLRLHTFVWGDEGPTVLLVHGWSGSVGQMTPFVSPLRRRGFRVVAHSAPAHGASGGTTTHVPEMARAVAVVARRFGPLHAIVAHSIGATAAARAVQGGAAVGRLAFVAPGTGPAGWVARFARAAGLTRIRARLVAAIEARAGARLEELELAAIAPTLHVPVLAIHDGDDPLVSFEDARRAVGAMPSGHLVETSGLGHFRILREHAVVREIAAFIGDRTSAAVSATRTLAAEPQAGAAA